MVRGSGPRLTLGSAWALGQGRALRAGLFSAVVAVAVVAVAVVVAVVGVAEVAVLVVVVVGAGAVAERLRTGH